MSSSAAAQQQKQSIKNPHGKFLISLIKEKAKDVDSTLDMKFRMSGYETFIAADRSTTSTSQNRFDHILSTVLTVHFLHDIDQTLFRKVSETIVKAIESTNGATKSLLDLDLAILSKTFPPTTKPKQPSHHFKIFLIRGKDVGLNPDDLNSTSGSDKIIKIEPVVSRKPRAWVLVRLDDFDVMDDDLHMLKNQVHSVISSMSLALQEGIHMNFRNSYEELDVLFEPAAERVIIRTVQIDAHRGDILLAAHIDRIAQHRDDLNAIIDMLDQKGVAVAVTTLDNEVQAPIRLLSTGGGTWRYSSAAGDNASVPDIAADKRLALSLADQSFAAGTQTRKDATLRQAVSQCSQLVFFVKSTFPSEKEWSSESQISVMKRACGRTADLVITAPPLVLMNCPLNNHPLYVHIKNGMVREGAHVVVVNLSCLLHKDELLLPLAECTMKKNIKITLLGAGMKKYAVRKE